LPQPEFGLKGTFTISLQKQDGFIAEPVVVKNELSDIQNRALALIAANSSITSRGISEALSITLRQTYRIIKQLKDNGYIEREGSRKTGTWIVENKMS